MKTKFNGILTLFLAFIVQFSFAQEKTISGTITDETGLPMPGVNIVLKGTSNGTQTDFDGNYNIDASNGDVLEFTFIGYLSKEVTITNNNTVSFSMEPDVAALEEVIVTAVGIKRKPDEITTAYENLKSDEIVAANNPDAVQALAGKVSGLQINTVNTGVNPDTQILLRGTRSLSGDNSALVVIDNVISTAGILSDLDPEIIESINILKGPNGAALYGSRGGNGVVVVTTKKGSKEKGKLNISLSSTVTLEEVAFLPQLQDRYGKGYWGEIDAFDQGSWGPEYDGSIQPTGLPYPTITDFRYNTYEFKEDNIKDFFNTGVTLQNTLSLSGGDSEGFFSLSANKRKTEGLIPEDEFKKDFFALSAGKTFGKWSISGNARFTNEDTEVTSAIFDSDGTTLFGGAYSQLSQVPSDIDVTQFSSGSNSDHWTAFGNSPYWVAQNQRSNTENFRSDLSGELSYKFNDNISTLIRTNIVTNSSKGIRYNNDYTSPYTVTGDGRDIQSSLRVTSSRDRRLYTDLITNFNYQLTEDIELKSLIGFNATDYEFSSQTAFGRQLTLPGLYTVENISGGTVDTDFTTKQRQQAIFANVDLGYKDYLFLNLTGRQEWDSRLQSPGREIGDIGFFYWSAGTAFIATKAFPELKSKALNKLKISGGYVKVANISALDAHDLYDTGFRPSAFPYPSGVNSFLIPSSTFDSNIEPEFINTYEANINLEFLKKGGIPRITLDGSYSFYTNENQILSASVSSATSVFSAGVNVGETETNAYEVDLGLVPIKTDDFRWNVNFGYASQKTIANKITEDSDILGSGSPGIYAVQGEEFPLIRGSAYERDEQGRVILNANGQPQVASGLKVLGKTTPDYILNFGTEFTYKGFKLSAVADFRTGHVFYSNIYNNLTGQGRSFITAENGRGHFVFPNSTVEGSGVTNTNVLTGPSYGGPSEYAQYQSFVQSDAFIGVDENFILDATAFKLREVALSYTLPSKFLDNTFINGLAIGLSGRNLLTVLPKENRGYNDPEIGSGIGGYAQTPPTRFYSMNVKLNF
ncbi:SusC/RagA family TonB-linked outer membrane protein [Lacinutrix sp. 5H-3-7-4]|uniref:SusC/RagA family TonB-linked outer membrane protein n=1 Tax=Lacinutrix sp. (strain 5H-3-7-4) TaxID=983544 RepID=UPI00020A3648|nr:SusC/RagA family TonB-linked outer membrane protein [Lacinutrix sp. 5H-3-7-4]AEH00269.1 TonB-dependent receptor plug [Lacinutrix sp. 5H-3-7-4]